VPNRHSFREAIRVALHDLHLSKIEPPPRKFNGAQQIAYTTVIVMGAGSLVTGIAILQSRFSSPGCGAARRLSMGRAGSTSGWPPAT